ncbi:MAG TPA: hypothetical protein PKA64_19510 [Myxococcota bacterium]|nr:hypothetical protein [Myxococcota bacterium]
MSLSVASESDIDAVGPAALTAGGDLDLRGMIWLHGGALALTAGELDAQSSALVHGAGAITARADHIDWRADVAASSGFDASADDDLELSSDAALSLAGDLALAAAGDLDLRAAITLAGGLATVVADELTSASNASIVGAAALRVDAAEIDWRGIVDRCDLVDLRADTLSLASSSAARHAQEVSLVADRVDWRGIVEAGGLVDVDAGALTMSSSGRLLSSGDVYVRVGGLLDASGRVQFNGAVAFVTGSWKLGGSHDFSANASCTISGLRQSSSRSPRGCVVR